MITETLIVFVIILGSMVLHELMHGLVAFWLGDMTAKDMGRLTLNPFKHIDPIMSLVVPMMLFLIGAPVFGGAKPVPINSRNIKWREWGMAIVALAGPITNFFLAFLAFLIGHFSGWLYDGDWGSFIFGRLITVNLGFMLFNLIPVPPLDGSRILYAIVPDKIREFMLLLERNGTIIVYALILVAGSAFSVMMQSGMNGILQFFYWIVGT